MAEETKILIMMGIAVLLLGLGVGDTTLLTENQYSDAYVCSVNEQVMLFPGGTSGSGYTGYTVEGSRIGSKRCKEGILKGVWISLEEYSLAAGIDPSVFFGSFEEKKALKQYLCNQDDCFELN